MATEPLSYLRLHGSPKIYNSAYAQAESERYAVMMKAAPSGPVWCIFDNTASGAAVGDALRLYD